MFVFVGFHEAGGGNRCTEMVLLWGKLPFVRGKVNREEVPGPANLRYDEKSKGAEDGYVGGGEVDTCLAIDGL